MKFYLTNEKIILLTNESIILKSSAHQNQSTLNPGIRYETNIIISALITNVKSQIVSIFIGKVNKIITGLIKVFITEITIATKNASTKPVTITQGRMYVVTNTATAVNIKLIIISIIFS